MLDRVADASTGGGGFNLLLNPFILLGIPPTATAKDVNDAYEGAVEHGTIEADVLRNAQHVLINPRLRIDAEVSGLLDVAPPLAADLIANLRTDADRESLTELIAQLPTLPKTNALAHLAVRSGADATQLFELIEAQARIITAVVCDAIIDTRKRAQTISVKFDQVTNALSRLEDQQINAVVQRLVAENNYAIKFAEFVQRVVTTGNDPLISKLAIFVRAYGKAALPDLSRRRERVITICNSVRDNPESNIESKRLLRSLRQWNEIGEPIQLFNSYLQRDEPLAREIYEHVRELCVWLNNDKSLSETAHTITSECADIFKALPRALDEMHRRLEIYVANIPIHRAQADTRRDIQTSAAMGDWTRAIALLEGLIANELNISRADKFRKLRDEYSAFLEESKRKADEAAKTNISIHVDVEQKSKEAARQAYRGAAGQRENIGANDNPHAHVDPIVAAIKANQKAKEEAQKAYRGAAGHREKVAQPRGGLEHSQPRGGFRWLGNLLILVVIFGGFIVFIMSLSPKPQSISNPSGPQLSSSSNPTFTLTRALVGSSINSGGQLVGVGTTFRGPYASVVGYASWTNGRADYDAITLTLKSRIFEQSCTRFVVRSSTGNVWCKWSVSTPDNYKIEISINNQVHQTIPFKVTKP